MGDFMFISLLLEIPVRYAVHLCVHFIFYTFIYTTSLILWVFVLKMNIHIIKRIKGSNKELKLTLK